jgi:hypothetical protein
MQVDKNLPRVLMPLQSVECVLIACPSWCAAGDVTVRFVVYAPRIEAGHSIWVTGAPAVCLIS